jgi:hypothetical protein
MVDKILSHCVMPVHRKRDLELRPDPIHTGHQNGPADALELCAIECTECANVGQDMATERRADLGFDTSYQIFSGFNVNAGVLVRHLSRHRVLSQLRQRYQFFFM